MHAGWAGFLKKPRGKRRSGVLKDEKHCFSLCIHGKVLTRSFLHGRTVLRQLFARGCVIMTVHIAFKDQ